jgi:hypothetical protein
LLGACGGGADSAPAGGGGPPVGTNSVTLEWDTVNPSPSGYRIYVGTTPGTYLGYVDAGLVTSTTITGLADGTYYFAATSYDALNNESGYSQEISKTLP